MTRSLLDTDTLTLLQFGHATIVRRLGTHPDADVALSVVSFQENHLIVVTRNLRDIGRVPGLQTEDWSV